MSNPITWPNVPAPTPADPSRALYMVGVSANSGFDALNKVLKDREATDEANWQQGKVNHTNALISDLYSATTTEEFQAKRSALMDQMRQYQAQVDAPKVLEAVDGRLGTLQRRDKERIEYDVLKRQEQFAPTVAESVALAQEGNFTQAKKVASDITDPRMRAEALIKLGAMERAEVTFQQGNVKFGEDLRNNEMERRARAAAIAASNAQANSSNAHARLFDAQIQTEKGRPEYQAAKLYKERAEEQYKWINESNMFGSKQGYNDNATVNTSNLSKLVDTHFDKDKDAAARIKKSLQENPAITYNRDSGGTPVTVGYPPAVVKKALELTQKNTNFFGGKYEGNFEENFKSNLNTIMHSDDVLREYKTYQQATANYLRGTPPAANLPAPTPQGTPPANASTAPLDRAASVVAPPNVPTAPKTQAQTDRTAFLQGLGAVGDAITFPGKVISDTVGLGVNTVGRVVDAIAGKEVVPKYQYSLGSGGVTALYDMATAAGRGNAPIPPQLQKTPENKVYAGKINDNEGIKVRFKPTDGDTGTITPIDSNQVIPGLVGNTARFDSFDANEVPHLNFGKKGQRLGKEAFEYLKSITEGKDVTIRVTGQARRSDTDRTRNLIQGEIDGVPIDVLMVKEGYAKVYRDFIDPNSPRGRELLKAEDSARTNRRGVWSKEMRSEEDAKDARRAGK